MTRTFRLFDTDLVGHRHGYMDYLAGEFADKNPELIVGKSIGSWLALVAASEIILISADYYTVFAWSIGFARRLLWKKTTAIYIAPHNLHAERGAIPAIKGTLLKLAKRFGIINGYAITPFDLEPRLHHMCRGWIYDIQFCAANSIPAETSAEAEQSLLTWMDEKHSEGMTVVVQLGYLWLARGSATLLQLADEDLARCNWAILMAGKMEEKMKSFVTPIPQTCLKLYDGLVSEEAFSKCLDKADLIWCYYPPHYDQSSGLFCNALMHGKQVIVRKDSYVDRFGRAHCGMIPVAPTQPLPIPADALILQACEPEDALRQVRDHNRRTIHRAVLTS